jgi:hypothetical protein
MIIMAFIDPALGIKLLYVLGITNIIGVVLVFVSCRCILGVRVANKIIKYSWGKAVYKYHCWYWWFFIISVILHTTLAFVYFGNPL